MLSEQPENTARFNGSNTASSVSSAKNISFASHGPPFNYLGSRTKPDKTPKSFLPGWKKAIIASVVPLFTITVLALLLHSSNKERCPHGDEISSLLFRSAQVDEIQASSVPRNLMGRRFVSVSSEHWGRWAAPECLWPTRASKAKYEKEGLRRTSENVTFTAEMETDLKYLYAVIEDVNFELSYSQRVVLTPLWVVGGPDIEAMKATGCPQTELCTYKERFVSDGPTPLSRSPYKRKDLRKFYLEGFEKGIWHPEYLGRAGIHVESWIDSLASDEWTMNLFEDGLVMLNTSVWDDSEYTSYETKPYSEVIEWIRGGILSFENFWGYSPRVTKLPLTPYAESLLSDVFKSFGVYGVEIEKSNVTSPVAVQFFNLKPQLKDGELQEELFRLRGLFSANAFVTLKWNAQNAITSMYDPIEANQALSSFRQTIEFLRAEIHGLVFVTSSELYQIRHLGWSREVWSNYLIFRNYNTYRIRIQIPDHGDLFPGHLHKRHGWLGKDIRVQQAKSDFATLDPDSVLSSGRWSEHIWKVGDYLELPSDSITLVKAM